MKELSCSHIFLNCCGRCFKENSLFFASSACVESLKFNYQKHKSQDALNAQVYNCAKNGIHVSCFLVSFAKFSRNTCERMLLHIIHTLKYTKIFKSTRIIQKVNSCWKNENKKGSRKYTLIVIINICKFFILQTFLKICNIKRKSRAITSFLTWIPG